MQIDGNALPPNMMRRLAILLPALVLGIAAFALVLTITDPPGPGLDPDALSYLGTASSLAEHGQYRVPSADWASPDSTSVLAHFPPGYPTALALPVRLGMAPLQAARLVQALAAFVTVATLVLLVGQATSPVAGTLFGLALFSVDAMHETHVSVLSEPLFLACTALTLAAMTRGAERSLRANAWAGVWAALGAATRYAGAALVGAAALWALVPRAPLAVRVRRVTATILPALLLQGAWVLRTRRVAGTGAIRQLAVYGALGATLRGGAATLTDWLVPDPGWGTGEPLERRGAAAVLVVALLAIVTASAVRRARVEGATRPLRLLAATATLALCYVGVLLASRLVADPGIPFDARILAPLLLLATTAAATALAVVWPSLHTPAARAALAAALAVWWVAGASVVRADAQYALDEGSDFAGAQWRQSALLAWAGAHGAARPLYTNWPAPVLFYLHRPSHTLPPQGDEAALAAFADTLRARHGVVLAFTERGEEFVTADSLVAHGLHVVARVEDGVVLAVDDQ